MAVATSDNYAFISFSSKDQAKAKLICDRLERGGIRCWISLRDVEPGTNYQASIVQAIQMAKIMVLVFSGNTNRSQEVHKELALASAFKVNVMPVRIVDVHPVGALLYELATRQWIDAFGEWEPALDRLVATARVSLGEPKEIPPSLAGVLEVTAALPAVEPVALPKADVPAPVLPQEDLDGARVALAHYLGPIATVLVRKESAKSRSLSDLHDRLAAHIQKPEEQAAFRRRLKIRTEQGTRSRS